VPLATEAQQPRKLARVAILPISNPESGGFLVDAFKQRLRELGYFEGQNVAFEIRWALGKFERFPELAKEVVALKPDVILVTSTEAAYATMQLTSTIPIVVTNTSDPVASGLARSLARPGANITGLSSLAIDTSPKLLELLLATVPGLSRVEYS